MSFQMCSGTIAWLASTAGSCISDLDLKVSTAVSSDVAFAVAARPDGTLYIVETGMALVVQLKHGHISTVAGSIPGYQDGDPDSSQLLPYLGIAVLGDGSVVVTDPGNYRIRRITFRPDGRPREVTTLAGSGRFGARDGDGENADFVLPAGLAVGPDGTIYVADAGNSLLRQPQVAGYFLKYVQVEGADKAPAEVLKQLEGTLKKLQEIASKPSLSTADVTEVKSQTDSVLALL